MNNKSSTHPGPLNWQVGWTRDPAQAPATFVPATVPGAVQLDWARAEGWPPHWQAENAAAYGWMEDVHWVYQTRLAKPALRPGQQLILVGLGIDYAFSVRVAGQVVHTQEGMFSPFALELTDAPDGARLEIVVAPAPKEPLPNDPGDILDRGRKETRQSCKPAVSYGWDFHPRLVPLGIWDELYLEVRSAEAWLDQVEVSYELALDFSTAELRLRTEGSATRVRWTLYDPAGNTVGTCEGDPHQLILLINQPRLWWPRSEGEAALYTSSVEVFDRSGALTQTCVQRVGLRRLRLVMAPGQFNRADGSPLTQPPVPMTMEVNGRSIFMRGANWVCPDIFPGTLTPERYRTQLDLFAGANLNFLRAWGGAIVNKTPFFERCDELGLLVWQEFPLACNRYEGTDHYLRVLDQESRAIIRRLRRHACLAIWCGGNELFNSWSGMTMQDHAIRLLDRNCFDLDRSRPFLPTSPLHGIRHGSYSFRMWRAPDAPTVFEGFARATATAYMEFGVPAPTSVEGLRRIIPEAELWPPRASGSWAFHQGLGAWGGDAASWLYPNIADLYFGPSSSLEELVERLQLLQCEGYKAIYEEGRRQKPVCSALACWVFNEPWPCAANNSIVAWPDEPKPGYFAVAAANRPTMASARIPHFDWSPGSAFSTQLFLLNDAPTAIGPMDIRARLETKDAVVELGCWPCPGTAPNTHLAGPILSGTAPDAPGRRFRLIVDVAGHPECSSTYTLITKHHKDAHAS